MAFSKSFLNVDLTDDDKKCIFCDEDLNEKGLNIFCENEKLLKTAEQWRSINIPEDDKNYFFRTSYYRLQSHKAQKLMAKAHESCRTTFRLQSRVYLEKYGNADEDTEKTEEHDEEEDDKPSCSKSPRKKRSKKALRLCFICDQALPDDRKAASEGGLIRCEKDSSKEKLLENTEVFLRDPNHKFHCGARRLKMLLAGAAHDIFAADIFYHRSCYRNYVRHLTDASVSCLEGTKETSQMDEDCWNAFFLELKIQIVRKKRSFLLRDLLSDMILFSEENEIQPLATYTLALKREIVKRFEDDIRFYPSGRDVIVHSASINPCEYSVAALAGRGLRDSGFERSFSNYIRRKMSEYSSDSMPNPTNVSADHLAESIDHGGGGVIPALYNVIFASMYGHEHRKTQLNEDGFANVESMNVANKIWAVASDWQSLITRKSTPKQAILGLTIHRLTGSKEAVMNLHSCGHSISYNDIMTNHDEADTRLVFHAVADQTSHAVVVSKDTDVLVLLVSSTAKIPNPTFMIYQKIDHDKFVVINDVVRRFECVAAVLPQIHALTGCDTTAFKFNVGKVKVMKKVMKSPSCTALIKKLGQSEELTDDTMSTREFIRTILYAGAPGESYIQTRIRLYKALKSKSSAPLPADPDSIVQEIKRCHLQAYIFLQCTKNIIHYPPVTQFGWRKNDQLLSSPISPIWFTGNQLPDSFRLRTKKKPCTASTESESDIDSTDSEGMDTSTDSETD